MRCFAQYNLFDAMTMDPDLYPANCFPMALDAVCSDCEIGSGTPGAMEAFQTFYPDGPVSITLPWDAMASEWVRNSAAGFEGLTGVHIKTLCHEGNLLCSVFLTDGVTNDLFDLLEPVSGACGNIVYNVPAGNHSVGGTLTAVWT